MNRIITILALGFILMGVARFESVAQTTTATSKEVLMDKSGRFIYSLARNGDQEIAFQQAYDDIIPKLENTGNAASLDVLKKSIQRIDNEVFNIYRVILFVDLNNLNTSGAEPRVVAPVAKEEEVVSVEKQVSEVPVATEVTAVETTVETVSPTEEVVAVTEEVQEELPASEVSEVSAETVESEIVEEVVDAGSQSGDESDKIGLPSGRLGDLIGHIMEQTTIKGVQNQLEKGKNSMVVSQYGSGKTKYFNHAFVVTQENKKIIVYSPADKDGNRINYSTGETVDTTAGIQLYWFLKR